MSRKQQTSSDDLLGEPNANVNDPSVEDDLEIELESKPAINAKGVLGELIRMDLTQSGEKQLLVFGYTILDGEFAGEKIEDLMDATNPNVAFKRDMHAKALQAPQVAGPNGKAKFVLKRKELLGRKVVMDIAEDPQYGPKIKKLFPATAAQQLKASDIL